MGKVINIGFGGPNHQLRAVSSEDDRMDAELRQMAEMVRRKLVAIRGAEFARRVLSHELMQIPRDCQGE